MHRTVLVVAADAGSPLPGLAEVARNLARVMLSPRHGQCNPGLSGDEHRLSFPSLAEDGLLIHPTAGELRAAIRTVLAAEPGQLLIAFLGHGNDLSDLCLWLAARHDDAIPVDDRYYLIKQVIVDKNLGGYQVDAFTFLLDLCDAEAFVNAAAHLHAYEPGVSVLGATSPEQIAYGLRFSRRLTALARLGLPTAGEYLYLEDLQRYLAVDYDGATPGQDTAFSPATSHERRTWLGRNPRHGLTEQARDIVDQHFPIGEGDPADPLTRILSWQPPAALAQVAAQLEDSPVVTVRGGPGTGKSCLMAAILLGMPENASVTIDAVVQGRFGLDTEQIVREIWAQLGRQSRFAALHKQWRLLPSEDIGEDGTRQPMADELVRSLSAHFARTADETGSRRVTILIDNVDQLSPAARAELAEVAAELDAQGPAAPVQLLLGDRAAEGVPYGKIIDLRGPAMDVAEAYLAERHIADPARAEISRIAYGADDATPTWLLVRIYADALARRPDRKLPEGGLRAAFGLVIEDAAEANRLVMDQWMTAGQADAAFATVVAIAAAGHQAGGIPVTVFRQAAERIFPHWGKASFDWILHELRPYVHLTRHDDAALVQLFHAELAAYLIDLPEESAQPWLPNASLLGTVHRTIADVLIDIRKAAGAGLSQLIAGEWFQRDDATHHYVVNAIAHHLVRCGDLAGAEEWLNRCGHPYLQLAVQPWGNLAADLIRQSGPDDPAALRVASRHAVLLSRNGQREQARDQLEYVLARQIEIIGPDEPDTVMTRYRLGSQLHLLGLPQQSVAHLAQVLAVRERDLGETDPATLMAQADLAKALLGAGDRAAARPHIGTVLRNVRRAGETDPELLTPVRMKLFRLLRQTERLEDALDIICDVVEQQRRDIGHSHPRTWVSRVMAAKVLRDLGEFAEAAEELESVLAEQADTQYLPTMVEQTQMTLVQVLMASDRVDEAVALQRGIVAAVTERLGPDHVHTSYMVIVLASILRTAGRVEESIDEIRSAYVAHADKLGPFHPVTLRSRSNLGLALLGAGQTEDGIGELRAILDAQIESLGAAHANTLKTRRSICSALRESGHYDQAADELELILAAQIAQLGQGHPETQATVASLGATLRSAGRSAEAVQGLLSVLGASVPSGELHTTHLQMRVALGLALLEAGRPAEAVQELRAVVDSHTAVLGPAHTETTRTQLMLCSALREAGRPAEAAEELRTVVEKQTAALGPGHHETIRTRLMLGSALHQAKRPEQAAAELLSVLSDRQSADDVQPGLVRPRIGLALALLETGRPAEAIEELRTVCGEQMARLGPSHPDTLKSRALLAATLQRAGRPAEAANELKEVVDISTATLGHAHPDVIKKRAIFSTTLMEADRPAEAVEELRGAVRSQLEILPADSLEVLRNRAMLGSFLVEIGRGGEAIEELQEVLELQAVKLGPRHLHTIKTRVALGLALRSADRAAEAAESLRSAFDIQLERQGPRHPDTFKTQSLLALALRDAGQFPDAVRTFREAWTAARDVLGPEHVETVLTQAQLGAALRIGGDLEQSAEHLHEVVAIRLKTLGTDHLETLMARSQLADTLYLLGRLAEARQQLEEVVRGRKARLGARHHETKRAVTRLSKLCDLLTDRQAAVSDKVFAQRRNAAHAQLIRGRFDDAHRQLEALLADQVAIEGPDSAGVRATKVALDRIRRQRNVPPTADG